MVKKQEDKKDIYVSMGVGSVKFKCPSCGKADIIRSAKARKDVVAYTCASCGFRGPN